MVSELGRIYSVGRHWTGSMIELGHGPRNPTFETGQNWMAPVDDSPFSCLSYSDNECEEIQRDVIPSEWIIEQFLEATSSRNESCKDVTNGSINKSVLPSSIVRYLLEIIKEKSGSRHSIMSLFLTEMQESTRKKRCRSCEPQIQGSQLERSNFSSFIIDLLAVGRQHRPRCPISPQRKRLSLSDSEVCYAKDLAESTELAHLDDKISPQIILKEDSPKTLEVPTSSNFQLNTPSYDAGLETEEVGGVAFEGPKIEKIPLAEISIDEVSKIFTKKTVRFADDIGDELFQERLITDTSLPPTLCLERTFSLEDEFQDMGYSLPSFTKPGLGPKHNSLPDMMKIPPPLPKLHHFNSSSGDLTKKLKSPSNLISRTNGTINWRLTFAQPAAQYLAFRQRLESNYVSLENISIANHKDVIDGLYLNGTIKVKNVAFEKQVKLRATYDKWASYKDYPAVHKVQLSGDGGSPPYDTFIFNFCVEATKIPEPRQLQFAVCFQAGRNGGNGEYWDNNDGCNYLVVEEIIPVSSLSSVKENFFRNRPLMSTNKSRTWTAAGGTEHTPSCTSLPVTAYTQDYKPNFNDFSSLTSYSSWQHYSSELMYY